MFEAWKVEIRIENQLFMIKLDSNPKRKESAGQKKIIPLSCQGH
jgi:hypothetical protein